jgi:hypothetical protein
MPLALRTRGSLLVLAALLAAPPAAHAQIAGGSTFSFGSGQVRRNSLAYDRMNQVYLAIVGGGPITARFLTKSGAQIGADFPISFESGFVGWVSIAFGGPPSDPTFLVTYILADDVLNPKFGRFVRYVPGGAPTVSAAIHIADVTTAWYASEKAQQFWNGQHWVVGSRVLPPGWTLPTPQINLLYMNGFVSGALMLGDGLDHYGAPALSCAANGVCVAVGYMAGIPTGYSGGTFARRFDGATLAPLGNLFYPSSIGPNEDQGVVYQTHTGMFLAQWFRGGGAGYIDTRRIGTDGSMSTLDLSRGIGPGAGTNAIAFNEVTQTSLLITKRAPDTALVVMELGDDGYPINAANTVVVTNWDGQVPDYWPSVAVNLADRQWLITAVLSVTTIGKFINAVDEWVDNGTFSSGMANWAVFAQPSASDLVTSVTNGVLSFYRLPPPPGTPGQGVVFQSVGVGLSAASTLTATFDLGNSSAVRKRITVLLHDADFSDLQMCTFWLPPASPLRAYRMNTHANQVWDNATISFYAATTGSDGGAYLLDNVHAYATAGVTADRTECVDPLTPGSQSFPDSNSILVNGNFDAGMAAWGVFGQITHRVQAGVFEFVRPTGTPAGVVLQATGLGLPLHTRLTLTLRLGNSSGVRKRVTVLVHDNDFSDLSACTFWLSAGEALATHTVKLYTTKAWTNATLSVYPSAVDTAQWFRLDDASLKITLSAPLTGTECIELPSGGGENVPGEGLVKSGDSAPHGQRLFGARTDSVSTPWTARVFETGLQTLLVPAPIDLRDATSAALQFESRLSEGPSEAVVEVTRDGVHWMRLAVIPASDEWSQVLLDLSPFAGDVIYARFVYAGIRPEDGMPVETWAVRDIFVDVSQRHWPHALPRVR